MFHVNTRKPYRRIDEADAFFIDRATEHKMWCMNEAVCFLSKFHTSSGGY